MVPRTEYAKSGEVHIAYQVVGDGPIDLIYIPTWINQIDVLWEDPSAAAFLTALTEFSRLILFDRRGSGLSDPVIAAPTLEEQMDDVLAVMEAAGSERAAIFAQFEGGAMAMLFAATFPERTSSLVLYATPPRFRWAPDYPFALKEDEGVLMPGVDLDRWGEGTLAYAFAPSRVGDRKFVEWFAKLERSAASPRTARMIIDLCERQDVRHVLPSIRVPTLIMHKPASEAILVEHSRYLVEHIPGARYVELPGTDPLPILGDRYAIVEEIEEFITGSRHSREPDRVLATVLFTDIVGSTQQAARLGDARWRSVLEGHERLAREHIGGQRGRMVKSTGDGVLATFDGPGRAIRCADELRVGARDLGVEVRAGLHTGELEVIGDDVGGLAVHIGARVMGLAGPSEVLVSSTVKDLVVGSGLDFEDRGGHTLRGVPGEWRLYALA